MLNIQTMSCSSDTTSTVLTDSPLHAAPPVVVQPIHCAKRRKIEVDSDAAPVSCESTSGAEVVPLKRKSRAAGKPKSKVVEVNVTVTVGPGEWPPEGLYLDRSRFRLKRSKGSASNSSVRLSALI